MCIDDIGEFTMKTIADSLREEGIAIGRKEGQVEGKLEVARSMLLKNMSIEIIHDLTNLPIEQIEKLRKK
jgi:predicted transposase/invertase (TIGR01784 family)